jgi:hypothetical protein
LEQYLAWWLVDIVEPKLASKTVKAYTDVVRLHLAPELGRIELGKVTPQAVTSLLRKKERDGLSPRSSGCGGRTWTSTRAGYGCGKRYSAWVWSSSRWYHKCPVSKTQRTPSISRMTIPV